VLLLFDAQHGERHGVPSSVIHRAVQQAFREAHEHAFQYFQAVFRFRLRQLRERCEEGSLRGSHRKETARLTTFRSHWQFQSEFCTPAKPHEKAGIKGEAGYFAKAQRVATSEYRKGPFQSIEITRQG
jgi:hypothetical protein